MSPRRPDARPGLPDPAAGLSRGRRWTGLGLAVVGLPVLTLVLERVGDRLSLGSMLLLYLLAVVVVAVVGGIWPAVLAALGALLAANWFFTPPFHTLIVSSRDQVVEFAVFAVVSVLVSVTVDLAARARAHAARSQVEARLLTEVATAPLDELSLTEVLDQVRTSFGMTSAALVRTAPHGGGSVVAAVGEVPDGEATIRVHASGELDLVAHGPELFAEDRTVLQRLAAAAARAWEGQHLAVRADQLVEVDRVRSALLAAVGHDLRTPLSGLKAAVSSLRQEDVEWSDAERDELLGAIESSADRLTDLIANLLDMTRIQVGAVTVDLGAVALDEVVALATLDVPADQLRMAVPDDLPLVLADVVLLERVVANLVDNALRHSPPGSPVELTADVGDAGVELRVVDHGPGVPGDLWPVMFEPFQRLGDRATGAGAGLGLAIVRGFCDAMRATVRPGDTPGGGLTMTVTLTEAHA